MPSFRYHLIAGRSHDTGDGEDTSFMDFWMAFLRFIFAGYRSVCSWAAWTCMPGDWVDQGMTVGIKLFLFAEILQLPEPVMHPTTVIYTSFGARHASHKSRPIRAPVYHHSLLVAPDDFLSICTLNHLGGRGVRFCCCLSWGTFVFVVVFSHLFSISAFFSLFFFC
ncbi:hypothetical protein TcCL_NonESM07274 [Trypanosoma cruzi]|nr:hypothetical protein TcCL_NonESM07274 [Trypanosoma cruzi]